MKVLITGIAGQDGFYLSQECSKLGWQVTGTKLRHEILTDDYPKENFNVVNLDLSESDSVETILTSIENLDIVFHLAGKSSVAESWISSLDYFRINSLGSIHLMQEVLKRFPDCKFILAGSAEIFDPLADLPWNSTTKKSPSNPYGLSKLLMYEFACILREQGFWISTAFLFNHESPRRGSNFLSRKVISAVGKIHMGQKETLELDNLDSYRDWGFAPEYMQALIKLSEAANPIDVSIGTGKLSSVHDFVEAAFLEIGIPDWNKFVKISKGEPVSTLKYFCDINEAQTKIQWQATTLMPDLAQLLVRMEINELLEIPNSK
jgi:GDPmannose 4,6-dehydratase